ncbi:MAG: DUF4368 domain-containing protein, partial [Candidatus Limiplasma sp.]|nr:DUF4368 domain-containing protein [Candidatus Limiplasma sp.]
FKKMKKGACTKHSIRSDRVEAIVLETLRRQIDAAVEMDSLIARINASAKANRSNQCLTRTLTQKEREKTSLEKMKLALYPDWKNGDLTREEYQQLRADFDRRIAGLEEALVRLRHEAERVGEGVDGSNAFLSVFVKYRNLEKLSREIVVELIDAIYVHQDGSLTIQFRFEDAFEQAVQYIRQNRQLADGLSG